MSLGYTHRNQENTKDKVNPVPSKIPGPTLCHYDMWRKQNWEILTHGGFVTFPHHDAAGLCTYVYVESGAKLWAIFRPYITGEPPREWDLRQSMDAMWSPQGYKKPFNQAGTILLEPGDIL
jgi:hypothetical protein